MGHGIITVRGRFRMEDDSFFAEVINILVHGVTDGGSVALDKLYREQKDSLPNLDRIREQTEAGIDWLLAVLAPALRGSELFNPYQVQMLLAAYLHQVFGLPSGRIEAMPNRVGLDETEAIIIRLAALEDALSNSDIDGPYREFVVASSGGTIRMASRAPRFLAMSRVISRRA